MQSPIVFIWKLSWRRTSSVALERASKTSAKSSALFWVSALFTPTWKKFSSLASWTRRRLCSKISWHWSTLQTLFFKTEFSLLRLAMERALQAKFRIGFSKTNQRHRKQRPWVRQQIITADFEYREEKKFPLKVVQKPVNRRRGSAELLVVEVQITLHFRRQFRWILN